MGNRADFIKSYFILCEKHGYYLDAVRSSSDLRVFGFDPNCPYEKELFEDTKNALLDDLGV